MTEKRKTPVGGGEYVEVDEHPSYGSINVTRATSAAPVSLFGSSIKHTNIIRIAIATADRHRNLNEDRVSRGEELMVVEMSQAQWAQFVSSMGIFNGSPCTISRFNGKSIPDPPEHIAKKEVFEKEFQERLDGMLGNVETALESARAMLQQKGTIKAADKAAIVDELERALRELNSNLRFVYSQFNESADKTMQEAASELEAMLAAKVRDHGLAHLMEEAKGLLLSQSSTNIE